MRIDSPDETNIEASVTIRRPVEEVFGFYRDFKNLPSFLGDVTAIEPTGPARYRWTILGPFGVQVRWNMKVTEECEGKFIRYETTDSARTRTHWEIYFEPGPTAGETKVREVMRAPGGKLVRAALALIGKHPAQEVAANLRRLKEVMETGRVTDMTYSVQGKFPKP